MSTTPSSSSSRRSTDRGPLLVKVVVGLVVLAGAVYGAKSWLDHRALDAEIAEVVAEAEELHLLQNYSQMAVVLGDALKKSPDHWELLYQLGRADLGNRSLRDATEHLEAAANGAPTDQKPKVYLRLGQAYEARLKAAKNEDKKDWLGLALSCYTEAEKGEDTKARALWNSALLEVAAFRADVARVGALRRALQNFERLIAEHPEAEDVDIEEAKNRAAALARMLDGDEESEE